MKVTADDIAQLLASAPPRKVQAHVLKAARRHRAAWGTGFFGLFFAMFSVPFMWTFFPWRMLDEWRLASGSSAPGVVTRVADSRMSVNGQRVMEYTFTYTDPYGATHTGTCYANEGRWAEGGAVNVRYLKSDPEIARIEGGHLNKAGWFGGFVVLFPSVGFGMVGWFLFQRAQAGQLLRSGLTAEVDILSVEPTNTHVNKQPVFEIVMSAPHLPAGGRMTIKRVNQRDIALVDRHLEEKQPLFVLYDPRRPKRVLFPEGLIENE